MKKIYKAIKNLTQEEIRDICKRTSNCSQCCLRKVCCLTADVYTLIQKYKKSGDVDCEMERQVHVWKD